MKIPAVLLRTTMPPFIAHENGLVNDQQKNVTQ
jgi:hypothetical protein